MDDEVFDAPDAGARAAESELVRVGRFPLIRRLGAGGMGAVYAAYDELLDRKVALKVMHSQRAGSIGQRQRTLVEARALARVTHPAVVTVYEVGEANDQVYISMEYIEGATLSDWCSEAPHSWRQLLDMYLSAGDGLAAAHRAGIVHRDFKPDNVLVGRDGRPRVVDFGLARLGGQSAASIELPSALSGEHGEVKRPSGSGISGDEKAAADSPADAPSEDPKRQHSDGNLGSEPPPSQPDKPARPVSQRGMNRPGSLGQDRVTRVGSISGTPGYMSPEQYIGGDVDSLSDQFSFCAALFEALYGFLPFSGETVEELAEAVHGPVREPPPSSKVPIEVHRALLRGLSVDPKRRFPTMDALLAALRIEQGHSAAGGAHSRKRMIRTIATLGLVIVALIALRVTQRTMATRDAAIGSVILLGVVLALGQLQRDIFLSNLFHRRIYLVITMAIGQNLLQRLAATPMGWTMKQIFPFEMVVWAGASVALFFLGLQTLWPLPLALLGMGALSSLWPALPKPFILLTYLFMVTSIAIAWMRAGRPSGKDLPSKDPASKPPGAG